MINKVYLGDGVYASFDGFMIWLDTLREGRIERIALEPEVFDSLLRYAKKCFGPEDQSFDVEGEA